MKLPGITNENNQRTPEQRLTVDAVPQVGAYVSVATRSVFKMHTELVRMMDRDAAQRAAQQTAVLSHMAVLEAQGESDPLAQAQDPQAQAEMNAAYSAMAREAINA